MSIRLESDDGYLTQQDGSVLLVEDGAVADVTGSGAIVEPGDAASSTGTFGTVGHLEAATLTASVVVSAGRNSISASNLSAPVLVSPRFMSGVTLVGYALLGPRQFAVTPPLPSKPRVIVEPYKRPIAPVKQLPTPPKTYDPNWSNQNQAAILGHLNDTLSKTSANDSMLMRSPDGKVFEITVASDGTIKATYRQG